ncbi:unnamed protein product [marine sediment metagenome]|uniref:Uncharacterized protein n=1 Tax=marine sediment metagenome TaxID=412755 RepID=X1R5D5_9ZZZZ
MSESDKRFELINRLNKFNDRLYFETSKSLLIFLEYVVSDLCDLVNGGFLISLFKFSKKKYN